MSQENTKKTLIALKAVIDRMIQEGKKPKASLEIYNKILDKYKQDYKKVV